MKILFEDNSPNRSVSADKDILSFNFAASENPGLSKNVIGTVNATTIDLEVPYGTNISSLVPDIRINGATVFPADGDAVDFSGGPVTYTVEAYDSSIKVYTVSVVEESWKLQVTTTAPNQNMTIALDSPVNIVITWGDGQKVTTNLASITHTYSSIGVYVLQIQGQASGITFHNPDANAALTGLLSPIKGVTGITSCAFMFWDCSNIKGSIPVGFFDDCPMATSMGLTFFCCTGLTGPIPVGLFDKNTLVTDFYCTFAYTGITGPIPAGLFDNCPQVTSFWSTFGECPGLTGSIPPGLFDNNPLVTLFYGTFWGCTGLTGPIPAGLFNNCPLVQNFDFTFYQCQGLTSIPSDLFNGKIFANVFRSTFKGCTGITSAVPELWVTHPSAAHLECFFNVINASNYGFIPADWK